MATASQTKLMTADEFMAADLGEGTFELVRGEVVEVPPAIPDHGVVCANSTGILWDYGRRSGYGYTLSNDAAVLTERDPDTVRGADVCFYSHARWPRIQVGKTLPPVPPDLAVEVHSPGNRRGEMQRKVSEYLTIGTLMVWVIYPASRSIAIHRSDDQPPLVFREGDVIENLPELPGFRPRRPRISSEPGRGPRPLAMTIPSPPATVRRPWWPWVMLGLGLIWTVLIRIPLILNAEDHLDSDLAVDGLTLLDAVNGRWRWHYPGTPHMGILPLLYSYPQALIRGADPIALVSGGTAIWVLVVIATFWLAWRVYGPSVAGWAIVPLVFSSLGTIWLSGRITGGHLLTLAWHTLAFVGLHACLTRGDRRSAALLGVWCGLGLYLDTMFTMTLAGLGPAAVFAWLSGSRSRRGLGPAAAFLAGLIVGLAPLEIGRRVDPYDAYPSQFAATFEASAVARHVSLLNYECLPRLIAGTATRRAGPAIDARSSFAWPAATEWPAIILMIGLAVAVVRLAFDDGRADSARRAVGRAALLSAAAVVAGFLVHKNIYNSDNYRYLIFLLTPWSLGFGLWMNDLARRGLRGGSVAGLLAVVLAAGMSVAAFRWYRDTRHYLDDRGLPMRRARPPWSELLLVPDFPTPDRPRRTRTRMERYTIPPDVTHAFGGYWDVYRLSFLSGKRVVGIPYSMYPNRFPGWSDGLGPGRGKILILRPSEESASATRPAAEMPGGRSGRVRSARAIDWHPAFTTAWEADGRDPAELDRLDVVVP